MRRLTYILLFFAGPLAAQQMTYAEADSQSYLQYMAHDFGGLRTTVKTALDAGVDFYYLRMRAGILGYEKHRYDYALPHFEKAHAMNPADTLALEYLYYSYLFTGRSMQALELAASAPPEFRFKVNYEAKKLETFSLTAGCGITSNISDNENAPLLRSGDLFAQTLLGGNLFFGSAFVSGRAGNRTKLYGGLSLFSTQSMGIVQTPLEVQKESFSNEHLQLNAGFDYAFGKSWTLSAGFGFYLVNKSFLTLSFDSMHPGPPRFVAPQESSRAVAASVSVSRRFRYLQPRLAFAAANLGGVNQLQGEAELAVYPFGNSRFYFSGAATYLLNDGHTQLVFSQKLGGRITDRFWYEASCSLGNMNNYMAANGFVTYNTIDPVKISAGIDLPVNLGKMQIIPGYRFQQREGKTDHFSTPQQFNSSSSVYTNHLITTTVLWRF